MENEIDRKFREYEKRRLKATCMSFRDYFYESTKPIAPEGEHEYHEEIAAIAAHPFFEEDGYGTMNLGYDIFTDTCYVICKIENNGTTFVASKDRDFMQRLKAAGL